MVAAYHSCTVTIDFNTNGIAILGEISLTNPRKPVSLTNTFGLFHSPMSFVLILVK